MTIGDATKQLIDDIVQACESYGRKNIIVLWGPPGTGKSFISLAAAQQFSGHALFVKSIQFHPSYTYEDFVEGFRPNEDGKFEPQPGILQEWNARAIADPDNRYVLLIEELSRANISAVLGELLTYVEYRDRTFTTPITRQDIHVAANLVFLATMNPRDRSALELDDAVIRRMRIIKCPPSEDQLDEMLNQSLTGETAEKRAEIIAKLKTLFSECRTKHLETYEELMPFGHGVFDGINSESDLKALWHQQLEPMLKRPNIPSHPFYETIRENFPWV